MKPAENGIRIRVLGCLRIHVRVSHPVRLDFVLATVLSFRTVTKIHRPQRRLDFRLFGVLFLHDVSVTDTFACRLNRKGRSVPGFVAVDDRVKRKLTFRLIRPGFVERDVDPL